MRLTLQCLFSFETASGLPNFFLPTFLLCPLKPTIKFFFALYSTSLLFQIDVNKMPLGKLSKKQIESAYKVLTEVLSEIQGDKNPTKILDASNRFYTLIPHDFGLQSPPLLDNEEIIKVCMYVCMYVKHGVIVIGNYRFLGNLNYNHNLNVKCHAYNHN